MSAASTSTMQLSRILRKTGLAVGEIKEAYACCIDLNSPSTALTSLHRLYGITVMLVTG